MAVFVINRQAPTHGATEPSVPVLGVIQVRPVDFRLEARGNGGDWLAGFAARHPEVDVSFEGQVARTAETGGSIGRGLLIGLVGIFVTLSFQFRSYVEPLIVMLSIPLAFIGALWGHVLMGYYLTMPALIGAAGLAGIVVNNAILLIHFIKGHREQGLSAIEAAGQAARDRLRAILISSTTTIAGLLPLLAETSTQSDAIKPLVISVVFGLLSVTVLVLLVIPALYVLFDDWAWAPEDRGCPRTCMRIRVAWLAGGSQATRGPCSCCLKVPAQLAPLRSRNCAECVKLDPRAPVARPACSYQQGERNGLQDSL